ncbi:hypothetical protein QOZ80_5AG0397000 [Eleusine coracana subsp. coracana]|nr:hypothetical protein QOZ80_5AG0397000 [Eleusine coracana subsp. coracana]
MRPSTVLLLLIVAASGATAAHGHPEAFSPEARFWEQALPGTPMPEAIADLVKKGHDHAAALEHYPALPGISVCGAWTGMCTASMAAATGIFFHKAQLRVGSTMTLSFPAEPEPPILSHAVAENLPFANISAVLSTFNIPPGSTEARHVAATLALCRSLPHPGELKACAASLETTVRVAVDMLGVTDHGAWAATSEIPASGGGQPRQLYKVQGVTELDGDRFVGCHKVPFPYRVYQCHMTAAVSDKAYVVSLRGLGNVGGGGPNAEMLAFCHLDTAKWSPAHPAFEVLRVHPGTPVCHFMPYANLVFGNKNAIKP